MNKKIAKSKISKYEESSSFQKINANLNTTTLSSSFALTEETGIRRKSCCCRECGAMGVDVLIRR